VNTEPASHKRFRLSTWLLRIVGLGLLTYLLVRADLGELGRIIQTANHALVLLAFALIVPLIAIKTVRWEGILRAQSVQFRFKPAFLAYFGSLFLGLITPGRLGEFIKALHVSRDCGIPQSRALASVLADRLFDLYVLIVLGAVGVVAVVAEVGTLVTILVTIIVAIVPLIFLISNRSFSLIPAAARRVPTRASHLSLRLAAWISEVRAELRKLKGLALISAIVLTLLSYILFFGQAYLLALALELTISVKEIVLVTALGSLVALLPISISGLGTRDAVVVTYLGTAGVASEAALGYSLLVFLTFYIGSAILGAVAWILKPVPLGATPTPPVEGRNLS